MPSVVDNKQIVRAVVVADEVAHVAVQLVLRLSANIDLDGLGVVMEAVSEEGFEVVGLGELEGADRGFFMNIPPSQF